MCRINYFLILIFFNIKSIVGASDDVLCSEEFCEIYKEKNECITPSAACHIQNSTHNGELFPAEVPCNCCKICLENLREGEFCTVGSPDMAPPNLACGPGLYCTKDKNEEHKCQKMDHTPCFKDQIKFDKLEKSAVGSYVQRPSCDGDGNYNPVKCNIGQNCFCVNENGKRIFGESIHSATAEFNMKCECSRLQEKFSESSNFKYTIPTFRCLEDGSFDPMQCLMDNCWCVERDTGFPISRYNVSDAEYSNLSCYNNTIHRKNSYFHDCERIQWNLLDELRKSEDDSAIPFNVDILKCQPDGWFPPIQTDKTKKSCVDRYGKQIDTYSVGKDSPKAKDMNCKCARTRNLLRQKKLTNLPKCCDNGNFEKIQCRHEKCYCVNEDGIQISKELPVEKISNLICYNNGRFC